MRIWCRILFLWSLMIVPTLVTAEDQGLLLYTGGFQRGSSEGIYAFRLDTKTGKLTSLGLAAQAENPTYFAMDRAGRFLYTVVNRRERVGGVSAYSIDRQTGRLTLLNTVDSRGVNTCFVSVSPSGKYALTANYGDGSIAVFPIEADGRLSVASAFEQHAGSGDGERQGGPHAHSFNASADEHFAVAADLGLDRFIVYRFKDGKLTHNDPAFTSVKPGSGPRHYTFDSSGRHAYGVEELASAITAFSYDAAHGVLKEIETLSALPPGFTGQSTAADVQIHPSGRFLYVSNRGADTIAVFAVDAASGKLTLLENVPSRGKIPRIFALDPGGKFLVAANEESSTLAVFRIDAATGRLTSTGELVDAPNPTCVKFVPAR